MNVPATVEECPYCGNKKLTTTSQDYMELDEDIVLYDEDGQEYKRIPAYTEALDEMGYPLQEIETDNMGLPVYDQVADAMGDISMQPRMAPVMENTKIPYYKPDMFPLIVRKNVSIDGKFLGNSDIDFFQDQQNETNKYLTKASEKTLKGGSLVILPPGLNIQDTDEEMKLIRAETPQQMQQIRVHNLQADISRDMEMCDRNYDWARQIVGITDSYQGRRDATATSGKAKEFSAAQAAGRFESKKTMKKAAYAELYEVMFKFMLAYADEERAYKDTDKLGNDIYRQFNKWDFLEQDAAGEWFWNDRFMFSTDNSGGLAQNREAMWQETRSNFESGAFGNPQEIDTQILYWTMMNELHYPIASTIKKNLEEKKKQQEQLQQQMMQQQMAAQQAMVPQGMPMEQAPMQSDGLVM